MKILKDHGKTSFHYLGEKYLIIIGVYKSVTYIENIY